MGKTYLPIYILGNGRLGMFYLILKNYHCIDSFLNLSTYFNQNTVIFG